ncbi:MAG: hypothetical protein LIO46_01760 [Clostridiales bacterium]|nr:hypothetical protein [Clostridiales bacterium]
MNVTKKLLSLFLAFVLLCTGTSLISASNGDMLDVETTPALLEEMNTQIDMVLTSIHLEPLAYGYTYEELDGAYIGSRFQIHSINPTNDRLVYYPYLSADGKMIGIISVGFSASEVNVSAGRSLADELQEVMEKNPGGIVLVSNEQGIFSINRNNQIEPVFIEPSQAHKAARMEFTYQYSQYQYGENELKQNAVSMPNSTVVYDPRIVMPTAAQKNLANYQIVAQGSLPICWAGAMASMLRFKMPGTYGSITAKGVCDKLKVSYVGKTSSQVQGYLKKLLSSSYSPKLIKKPLGYSEVMATINNNDPIFVAAFTGSSGHAVAICGYNLYNTGFTVRIMNPGTGKFESMSLNSASPSFSYNGKRFVWQETVKIR